MHWVITWMLERQVIETAREATVLRRAFETMSYREFASLTDDQVVERLQAVDVHPQLDRRVLARQLLTSVVGKTITSPIEDEQLTGAQAGALRQATVDWDAARVLAEAATDDEPMTTLQAALRDDTLVTVPFDEAVGVIGMRGSAIATGDRAVACGNLPPGAVVSTGDNANIVVHRDR